MKRIFCLLLGIGIMTGAMAQTKAPKGKLFIIGGGDRGEALMKAMVEEAELKPSDYIMVLPMASGIPEESVEAIAGQFREVSQNSIRSINFTRKMASDKVLVDSVRHAKLIFVTGGDQNRFMDVVKATPLYDALHQAYAAGSLIAGTSAGAAIMSEKMITGHPAKVTESKNPFAQLTAGLVEVGEGMGFLKSAIIDQHFIARSRYTRLFSTLAVYPKLAAIGVDEGTAMLVSGNQVKVVGDAQVLVVKNPKKLKIANNGYVSWEHVDFGLYQQGESFKLK